MTLKLYKHKYHDGIYLARNWQYCGGCEDTEFYYATRDVMVALKDANRKDFESWMHNFLDENMKTRLKAKITDVKEIEIDGYTGKITKVLVFPVTDFVLVKLQEAEK